MLCKNERDDPYFFKLHLKCSAHNYQFNQVLENFKYFFYYDGIALSLFLHRFVFLSLGGQDGKRFDECLNY